MENTMTMDNVVAWDRYMGLKEADLVRAAQKGDLEAFNQLVILYQDRIYTLALRILGDEDSAEDITQEVFLTAYRSLPRFQNGSLRSWLYRIGTNACYDELRRRKRRPLQPLEDENGEEAKPFQLSNFPEPVSLPEKEVERHELEQVVQQALNRLDADQRAVVVLIDLHDLDYSEAAHILGVPLGTVKSRLARARLQLRNLLSEHK